MRILIKPVIVGAVAASIILIDSLISPIFALGSGFAWIAFISWTIFSNSNLKERLVSIPGLLTGFFFANLMVLIGRFFVKISIFGNYKFLISTMIGVFLINLLMVLFESTKKNMMGHLSAIFFSVAITFSGAGAKLEITSVKLLLITLVYGIVGLLCGYVVEVLTKNYSFSRRN